jgi:hypothetical protein
MALSTLFLATIEWNKQKLRAREIAVIIVFSFDVIKTLKYISCKMQISALCK